MNIRTVFVAAALVVAVPTLGADANAGKNVFRAQCALCHSAETGDEGGAQGPSLQGLLGRKAAATTFSYTAALKRSGLTWDPATLDRFLAAPTAVVPGSAMVVPVSQQADRENLVAYFTALRDGTMSTPARLGGPPRAGGAGAAGARGFGPPPAAAPPKGEADWKKDAPGRVHKVDVSKLPAPYDTPSASKFPQVVPKPADAKLSLPAGFKAEVFLADLTGPRAMTVAPNGDVFLSETQSGRIKVLRPSADGVTATVSVFATGMVQPYGIAFQPAGAKPKWVYVAETNRVVRYPYKVGDRIASGVPEVVVPELSPVGGGHYTRDIAFSKDGKRMYVSVGSMTNVPTAADMPKKNAEEARAWDAAHGVGAAWGREENRAGVRVFDVGGDNKGRTFATGIRNCVGMTVQPATGDLWCTTNERDALGDDLVPDYATRVKDGGFYGWPWYYMGKYEDPRLAGDRPDLAGKAIVPDVPFTAHSAATNIIFYTTTKGKSAFPAEYRGEAFVVLHGSWNRAFRTGHKIVRLPMKNGVPTGEYIDFLTGFITPEENAWGRPVGITVMKDGSMLLSDDGANLIYRISYAKPK